MDSYRYQIIAVNVYRFLQISYLLNPKVTPNFEFDLLNDYFIDTKHAAKCSFCEKQDCYT